MPLFLNLSLSNNRSFVCGPILGVIFTLGFSYSEMNIWRESVYSLEVCPRPAHEILVQLAFVSNDGSGESVHMHRLARAFATHICKAPPPPGYSDIFIDT